MELCLEDANLRRGISEALLGSAQLRTNDTELYR
eukprot:CAMPEP_0181187782 /NCGR_PEP_ID=MMETSP1096-20121128/10760_1 /TAXON_ID=156174 ORGANISM="Chrysochromulina ericina, Strain CCMP281" /NCGR_SAMPLE_ID=MMETSP1096 /ASSEMBLY_ACC=CAM_ASM_000453 /LENGTH=33 /DNA_ID= /DNA_START= /DNA_END= /DNA_ORIENTATION=